MAQAHHFNGYNSKECRIVLHFHLRLVVRDYFPFQALEYYYHLSYVSSYGLFSYLEHCGQGHPLKSLATISFDVLIWFELHLVKKVQLWFNPHTFRIERVWIDSHLCYSFYFLSCSSITL